MIQPLESQPVEAPSLSGVSSLEGEVASFLDANRPHPVEVEEVRAFARGLANRRANDAVARDFLSKVPEGFDQLLSQLSSRTDLRKH